MKKLKVVFTGGGTGGHVYPNIAIYETIREKYPEASFLYIGTKKGAEKRIVKNISQPIDFVDVMSRGIPQRIRSFKTLISLFIIFMGTIKSYFVLRRFKPDFIVGSGGYVAAPVLFAASLLKLKVFIHEQNAVPGRLNRFIARFASRVGVSFSSTANYFPEDKVVVTGYPLRRSIRLKKEEDIRARYKIPEKNKVIFIFGGSGGARTINNAVAELIPTLLAMDDITVILSTGRGYSSEYKAYDDTLKIFESIGIPPEVEGKLIIREYFDNIDEIYSIADLIVSRAGAGTIKEITTIGIPSILIPKINLPGDHQILNAREVERIGGAKVVYETVKLENNRQTIYVPETELLDTIKSTLYDGDTLFNMRKNLRQVEKQNSTEVILEVLENILKGKEKSDEEQLKVFYLQSQESEKNIELLFDNTTLGNSYFCDVYLDAGDDDDLRAELRIINKGEKIILRRLKGTIRVDDKEIDKWVELGEDSKLELGNKTYTLKSYLEKVEKVQVEKSTAAKMLGSSFGILLSRVAGLFRVIVIAAYFGAGRLMDVFAVGLTVANLMRRIVAENALENAFLPIFSRLFHRTSRKKTWESASSIVNFTLLTSLVFTVLLILLAPLIVQYLFPGLVEKGLAQQTVTMTRIIMPYLFLVTIAAVMTTYLKAFNSFGIAESSTIFFSLGTIAGVVAFYSSSGLYSLAYGILIGGTLQILFLVPFTSKILRMKPMKFSYKPIINFDSPINKKYYFQLGPISLDVIFSKVAEVVGKGLATGLKDGSVAFLHFSLIIFQLPFAVISQAISSVVLRDFSEKIALFDKKKAKQLFIDGVRANIFLLTPISVLMILLAKPIVSILLQRGQFDEVGMSNTAYALQFYALGLIGWGIHTLTVRIFSARIDIKTSVLLNFFMLLLNVGLCYWLINTRLEFAGVALATSISFILFSFIRIVVLMVKLGKESIVIKAKDLAPSFLKTAVASLMMVIVLLQAKNLFSKIDFNSRFVGNLAALISLSFIGISIYLLASLMLKNTELLFFRKRVLGKSPAVPLSMLSPFRFLDKVSRDPDKYKGDYFYKINIYISSSNWEVRNTGIKLIGLFKDKSKVGYLTDLLRGGKENGFIRRNAVNALRQLNAWNADIKKLLVSLMTDGYYETRVAALNFLGGSSTPADFAAYKELVHRRLKRAPMEEKLALVRLIAKIGDMDELKLLEHLFLSSNSLVREELLQLIHNFYRRNLISGEETKELIQRVLITSNNMQPEFKLKSIIKKIYKEIE